MRKLIKSLFRYYFAKKALETSRAAETLSAEPAGSFLHAWGKVGHRMAGLYSELSKAFE